MCYIYVELTFLHSIFNDTRAKFQGDAKSQKEAIWAVTNYTSGASNDQVTGTLHVLQFNSAARHGFPKLLSCSSNFPCV